MPHETMTATIRAFQESDRQGTEALGGTIVGWWHERLPTLHLVADSSDRRLIGHLQVADVGVGNPRRQGECDMILRASKEGWDGDAPQALLAAAIRFSHDRSANRLVASYMSDATGIGAFLLANGFVPFERYMPLSLDLNRFEPSRFQYALTAVADRGIHLFTYAEAGDSEEKRRRLFELETAARADQPFREVGPYVPQDFRIWETELARSRLDTIFLAGMDDRWVGLVRDMNWPFAGVASDMRGQGIATALKVWSLAVAKHEGLTKVETENHEDNLAMRTINLKLGFLSGPVETNCALII